MGDEQIKNSTFLESNNQLEDLKLQVLNIEHNYITVSDLDNYVTSSELHNYVTSYDFENTNVEIYNLKNKSNILSSKIDELEKIDLSVYVTNNQLEEKLNLMDKKLSDMSTYTKTEIDDKFSNINVNVDLSDYVKKSELPNTSNYLTSSELNIILDNKNYLTSHQSLDEYVKKSELTNEIDERISSEYESIQNLYDNKIDKFKETYLSTINELGYVTNDDVKNIVDTSLMEYVDNERLEHVIKNIDFINSSTLHDYVEKYVSSKLISDNYITNKDIDEYVKNNIPTKTSQLFNDSGYLTKHQPLDGYVKDSELSKYISRDEFENRINSLDIIDDLEKYLTKDDIKNIAYVSDIPTKLSDMFNDVGYLTKHQSLDGYVKKSDTDIFVTKPEIDDIIEKINTIKLEGFVTQNELEGYATKEDIIAQIIKHKQDLSNFVKSDDLEQFVKKTSIPNYDDFVRAVDLPDMSRYLLKDDINSFGFITLKDIPNVYKIVNDSLVSYVKSKEFNDYKKIIDKKQYQSKTDVINILDDYVKKSEIFEISGLDKNLVENMINNEISKIHVPSNLSELKNDVGYLTKHQSLSGYVKRHEISDFITISEANKTYIRINDFKLPDDIVYKSDIKDTVTKQDLMNVTKGFINKSQLNEYLMKPEFNKELSNIRENILGQLNDIKEIKSNITNINNLLSSNSENIVDKTTLEDYVNYKSFDEYKNKFSDDLTVQKQMLRELNEKISEQKTWTSINFVRKNELSENGGIISGGNNSEIDINENVIRTLLDAIRPELEPELESRFLLKEDYRGIKSAATINFGYNEYPDLFFKVMNNTSNIMINDGFYVVEEKAYIVRNNQIIPICDRKSPHWEIETTDENWEDELTKKEIHDLLDIPYDEEEKEESNEQSE